MQSTTYKNATCRMIEPFALAGLRNVIEGIISEARRSH